jgi:hypothetical protein
MQRSRFDAISALGRGFKMRDNRLRDAIVRVERLVIIRELVKKL